MSCCGKKTKGEFLWGKYCNFIKIVEEKKEIFPSKAVIYILGGSNQGSIFIPLDTLMPKDVNELMVLLKTFFIPFYSDEKINFEKLEQQILLKLNEDQQKDFEEIKKNTEFVELCKKYALGLTQIYTMI